MFNAEVIPTLMLVFVIVFLCAIGAKSLTLMFTILGILMITIFLVLIMYSG